MQKPKSLQVLPGQKYGRWLVVGEPVLVQLKRQRSRFIPCRCECGIERNVRPASLANGESTSCGCAHSDIMKTHARHGATRRGQRERLYTTWNGMKQRCLNPNAEKFPDYGGRGITVCAAWMNYEPFRDWALANGYADDLQIDRIDNDGSYEPGNCRFVNRPSNQRNRRVNTFYEAFGERKCSADWLKDERCNLSYPAILKRMRKGMTFEEALTVPKQDKFDGSKAKRK